MLVILLILLLVSSAVTIRRDKPILFSRIVIQSLLFSIYLVYNNLYTPFSISIYITNILCIILMHLIIICLTNLYVIRGEYVLNKLFRKERFINFGISILLLILIKCPASIFCSGLNTPWLYIIILGITSVLSSIITRTLWGKELYKARQLILIALLPMSISIISQLMDIDLIYAFCLISSSVLMSLGLTDNFTTILYMNPSGRTGSSGEQENSGGKRGYPNNGWTSVNKPLASSSGSNHINVSQQVTNIISQLPVEERFNAVSTPATSSQSRPVSSQQLTNVNRETSPQQVLATGGEHTPEQGMVLAQAGISQQSTDMGGNAVTTQVTRDNPYGYGNSYRNLPIDARNSSHLQLLYGPGYNINSLYNRDAGKRMADHFLYISRVHKRVYPDSFTPDMLRWLYGWSYHNNREYHNKAFTLGWQYPNYRQLSIAGEIRDQLAKLD